MIVTVAVLRGRGHLRGDWITETDLERVTIAVMRHQDPKQAEQDRLTLAHHSPSLKEVRTGTQTAGA